MPRSNRAEVEQAQAVISEKLQDLTEDFLDCRDPGIRHSWKKTKDFHAIPVAQIGKKMANLARQETCTRCGTVKTERFVVNEFDQIEKVSQSNDYPEGYLMQGVGVPRGVKRSTLVWTENYRRSMEKVAEAARGKGKQGSSKSKVTPLRRKAG